MQRNIRSSARDDSSTIKFFSDLQGSNNISVETLSKAFYQKNIFQHRDKLKALVERALEQGIDPNSSNNISSLLHNANNNKDITQLLLEKGANPNILNNSGDTPLHGLAKKYIKLTKEEIIVAKLLLKYGALTELTDSNGWTSLQLAARGSYKEIVKLLLQYGADINPKPPSFGFYEDKTLIELVPNNKPDLKALLKLAKACNDNDFSKLDNSVDTNNIKEFFDWKISIKPQDVNLNTKLFSKHLRELYNFKKFLETNEKFINNQELEKLNDTLNFYTNSKDLKENEIPILTLKTLLEFNITKNPEQYKATPKFNTLSEDLIEGLKEYEVSLNGEMTE